MNRNTIAAIFLSLLYAVAIYWIGYQTDRVNFNQFITIYLATFAIFYFIYLNKQQWNFKIFLALAVVLRLILLFAAPELSNDFYRFIWDGEIATRGVNPFAHTPNELISQHPFYTDQYMRTLYHGMSSLSQDNYSCYPVFNQILFIIPASLFETIQSNVIGLKVIIILADIGAILIGKKILEYLKKPTHLIWLYGLNPFVILEFAGNVHFEAVMIFFLLLSIYLILIDKWLIAGIFMGIAIQVKLVPLLLIPFVFKKLKIARSLGFTAITLLTVIGIGAIMWNQLFISNMLESIDLYFVSFEFNASIFYLFREYSFMSLGYDNIAVIGPILSKIAIVCIGLLAVFKAYKSEQSIFTGMLFALVIYYAFATTVHPWYISMLLILSVYTPYKFALIWSFLVMLSYFAYSNPYFEENLLFIAFEYVMVFGIMIYEIIKNTDKSSFGIQLKSFMKINE